MKKLALQLVVSLMAVSLGMSVSAHTWTVNNSAGLPLNPGQYSTISAAITAAASGDTILVTGTLTAYNETVTIAKQLTLIGTGYNPQYNLPTSDGGSVWTIAAPAANGTIIMGFQLRYISITGAAKNITIYRNYFNPSNQDNIDATGADSNIIIAENVFAEGATAVAFTGVDTGINISNNIFLAGAYISGSTATTAGSLLINHNLFAPGTHTAPLGTSNAYAIRCANAIVSNNIFYGVIPVDTASGTNVYTNNAFYNNITYASTTLLNLPYLGNLGAGNINNTNPLFTSAILSQSASPYLSFTNDNLRPQAGSPVINAGNDGTNIGPTGGLYPIYNSTMPFLTGEPPVPEIESMILTGTSAVTPGTPIQVQVKVKKIN